MLTFLYVLHFLVCFILIGVVLLQRGKGQDLGASLGGGSANTIFGSRGAGNFLTKITTASAIIFMGTSLSLSYLGYKSSDVRLFDETAPFVPEGAPPKKDETGLEEVPSAAAGAAEAKAADRAAGDGALVEVPSAGDGATSDPAAAAPKGGSPAATRPTAAPDAASPTAAPASPGSAPSAGDKSATPPSAGTRQP